ncbi:DMT family transporter [Rhizobium sp. Leaf341]|uniref:DMT family transporter n=1 Tax=Rhizobium sp. Leaf341 TaxID=1736344 RepID=UPI00071446F2|nr:DMT family transporter [Rhizobium sp. Leaf341]KQR69013.1 ABC transporter permease [Rhizobium sp. Leaf341]
MTITTTPAETRMTPLTWGLLALLGLIWGASFFFGRIAVQHVPAFTLVFLRVSIAALALHLFIRGRFDIYRQFAARWRAFLVLGLLNNAIPHSFIFLGQTQIGAGLASILNATTPIWTVLLAHAFTSDEKLSPRKIGGTALGLAGTVLLIGPSALGHLDATSNGIPLWALILPLGAAVSYGLAGIYGRRFRGLAPPVTAAGQLTASTLIMLPVSLLSDHPWTLAMPPMTTILAILALALVSTAYGYILFFRIMARAGATNTSLVTLLVPPSALLFGLAFLGERLDITDIGGMALIAAGLIVLDGRLLARKRSGAKVVNT